MKDFKELFASSEMRYTVTMPLNDKWIQVSRDGLEQETGQELPTPGPTEKGGDEKKKVNQRKTRENT